MEWIGDNMRLNKYDELDQRIICDVLAMIKEKSYGSLFEDCNNPEDIWEQVLFHYGGSELMSILDAVRNIID